MPTQAAPHAPGRFARAFTLAIATAGATMAVPVAAGQAPDGKALFSAKCQLCHGPDGVARPAAKGARNFNDPVWQEAHTDDQLVQTIREGRKGTMMAAFEGRLKEAEIRAIVAHIRTLAPKP